MKMGIKSIIGATCACLAVVSFNANTATVLIDEFTIVKNGNILFQDTFNNGLPPPDTGGNTQSYQVFGGPLGPESGGKLALDASGQAVERPDAGDMWRQGARVKTNTDPSQPDRGLRTDDTFSVTGLFDLTLVPNVRERYGVRLTDGGFPSANDSLGISVMRTSTNQIDVVFHHYDQTAFTFVDLESIELDPNHDQIALTLSRIDPLNNEITASFSYVDGGITGSSTTFATTDTIFNGEDFTRGQFMYLTPVPVPAAVWLFGSGLLGLIGLARRKKA